MKIRTKITGMGLLLVLLALLSIAGIALFQKKILERDVDAEVDYLVRSETSSVAQDVYLMCRAMQESLNQALDHALKVSMEIFHGQGRLDFNGPGFFTWRAVNQYSGESHQVVLPKVLYNGQWLGHNRDLSTPTLLVDKISTLQGVTCTLFQRMNEKGDMLRVATTITTSDGNRAIGTYIPRYNPEGLPNPVIEALLNGDVFSGRSYVVNAWYQTRYQPLWDTSGSRVIGALYVGQKQEKVTSLRRGIQDIVIGKSGYVAVLGAKGAQRGEYLISQGGRRNGENILKDDDLRPNPLRPVIEMAPRLSRVSAGKEIPTLYHQYSWQNPDEIHPRRKSAAIAYFEPWDWIIMATAYHDDYVESRQRMVSALMDMLNWIAAVGAVFIALSLLIGYFVTRGIVRPLEEAVVVFDRIGQGQLDNQLNVSSQDEIGQLSRSFNQMVINLKEVTASREELNYEILERIKIENALRESQEHLEELVEVRTAELAKTNQRLQEDVLLRKEAEERLLQANQELESFAYTVSHNLRTPLTPILGYADFLNTAYRECLDEQALNCLAAIAESVRKMEEQIADLLFLARMGHLERPDEPIATGKVVRGVIENLEKQIAASGITVIQEQLPAVRVPESVVSQIFDNLIANAVRYAGIEGSPIEIGGERKGDMVQFFVRDHGPGIPEDERGRIFDVFYRGTSAKKIKGTGVGLATVMKIARTYGGRAWVEETPGGGSTFRVEMLDLPIGNENELHTS